MRLKTLKEINEKIVGNSIIKKNIVYIDDLREEAIKWLKTSDYDLYELGFDKSDTSDDLKHWIKHFFNITGEDLK